MEENNTGFSSSVLSQEESDKIFGKYKSFDDYFKDPTHPYALVKVFIDGNELKASYTVEFTQRTNDHDTFKIITPDDSFDSFEGYLLEKSRYLFGKDVLIEFARFGKVTQTFEGIITNMNNPKHEGGGYGDLHILGAGKSILLESGKDCQSFEDKSLSQIIKEVCEDYPQEAKVKVELPNTKHSLPYTVQYKESDYQFLRILKNGQKYYHHSTDEYTLY